jgi:hypothetical protein
VFKISTIAATLALAGLALSGQAQAQDAPLTGLYANLGYANLDLDWTPDSSALQGRLGYRFNTWLGVEGEIAGGLKKQERSLLNYKVDHSEAIYGVGFLPLSPKWDLIGRIGYGHTKVTVSAPDTVVIGGYKASVGEDSWNVGGGVQYHFDGRNGVRADYTRHEYQGSDRHADVWSIAYSRRF